MHLPNFSTWSFEQALQGSIVIGAASALVLVAIVAAVLHRWNRPSMRGGYSPNPDGPPAMPVNVPPPPGPAKRTERPADVSFAGALVTDVVGCARCGGDHPRRLLLAFTRPPEGSTHYTVCPTTDEPILVAVGEAPIEEVQKRNRERLGVPDPNPPAKPTGPPNREVREGEQPRRRPRRRLEE